MPSIFDSIMQRVHQLILSLTIVMALFCSQLIASSILVPINKGNGVSQSGDYPVIGFDKALAQPNDNISLINKASALAQLGNYTGAIKYYDKALAAQPNGNTFINKANAFSQLGKYEEAIKSYDKALAVQPNRLVALANKAHALFELGNYTGAIKYYDKALARATDGGIALFNDKAHVLFELGNYTGAIKYYDKALAMAPNTTTAREGKLLAVKAISSIPK